MNKVGNNKPKDKNINSLSSRSQEHNRIAADIVTKNVS